MLLYFLTHIRSCRVGCKGGHASKDRDTCGVRFAAVARGNVKSGGDTKSGCALERFDPREVP